MLHLVANGHHVVVVDLSSLVSFHVFRQAWIIWNDWILLILVAEVGMVNFLFDILKVTAPQIDGFDCCDVALDL